MAAAVDATERQHALEAKIREMETQLTGATGDKEVALLNLLATLEQQKLFLMQQQSGATGWAHSQGAGVLGPNDPIREQILKMPLFPSKGSAEQVSQMMQQPQHAGLRQQAACCKVAQQRSTSCRPSIAFVWRKSTRNQCSIGG